MIPPCPKCGSTAHQCATGDAGCFHCDSETCGLGWLARDTDRLTDAFRSVRFASIGRDVVEHLVTWHDKPYRCWCSWVGGDPDGWLNSATCPACWHHDKRRVRVVADVHRRPILNPQPAGVP